MVRRIYVEKKKGFDVAAASLFNDVKENLHLEDLTGVRVLNRYDVDGIDDATYEAAKFSVFAEPAIDVVYEETMPEDVCSAIYFAVEYLPGQYDQRADSAAQCIQLQSQISSKLKDVYSREMLISSIILKPHGLKGEDVIITPGDAPATEAKMRKGTMLTNSNKRK